MPIAAVMIDQREPEWVQRLTFGDVATTVTLLDTGDLHVATTDGGLILVERKTPDDFLNSLRDDRLFTQCANMILMTRWAYLVVTGEFRRGANGKVVTDRETGWSYQAVQGALLTLQEIGIFVVFSAGDQDYEASILRLAERSRHPLLLTPARQPRELGLATALLCGFPGLGPERAQKLMDFSGSVKMALVALTGPDPIPGIPSNVKHNARALLQLDDNEQMYPLVIEEKVTP